MVKSTDSGVTWTDLIDNSLMQPLPADYWFDNLVALAVALDDED